MDIQNIRAFLAVAESESFSRRRENVQRPEEREQITIQANF